MQKLRNKLIKIFQQFETLIRISICLKKMHFEDKSLKAIFDSLKRDSLFPQISFSSFKNFVSILGLRYKKIFKKVPRTLKASNQTVQFGQNFLNALNNPKAIILFFDITGFSDASFKKKAWNYINSKTYIKQLFSYNLTHMLGTISNSDQFFFQFFKGNLNNFDIINYLKDVALRMRRLYPKRKFYMILDNAKMHQTRYFKNFSHAYKINLIYTVPQHPAFNPVEFCFRYLKSEYKQKYSLL
jgi:DDE superfamily endonuclease